MAATAVAENARATDELWPATSAQLLLPLLLLLLILLLLFSARLQVAVAVTRLVYLLDSHRRSFLVSIKYSLDRLPITFVDCQNVSILTTMLSLAKEVIFCLCVFVDLLFCLLSKSYR